MDVNEKTSHDDEIAAHQMRKHFLDYIIVILKRRRFITINFVFVVAVAIGTSFLLPKWYKATVSILSPRQSDIFGNIGASSSSLRSIAGIAKIGGMGQRSSAYNYLAILNSRSAMEKVINKFNLKSMYQISDSSMEKAIKELQDNVSIEEQKDDYYTIEVQDKDPTCAADMANYFVEVLNSISVEIGTREARNNREFIEQRLFESKDELRRSEDALRTYQERSGMMINPEETSGISDIAYLYGLRTKKEVEYAIAERNTTADNTYLRQLRVELDELDRKLAKMPQTAVDSYRLFRDVAIHQRKVEFLVPLYEQAKIDEQKDIPVVLVLDRAVPPEKKSKPKRLIIILVASAASLLFSLTMVFIQERISLVSVSDPYKKAQLNSIRLMSSSFFRSKQ